MKTTKKWALALGVLVCGAAIAKLPDPGVFLNWQIPFNKINAKYKVDLTQAKIDAIKKGVLKVAIGRGGGSATFVSPHGLVYTNWHIVHSCVETLRGSRTIPEKGYFDAETLADELKCPNYELRNTVEIRDVSKEIRATAPGSQARENVTSQLVNDCEKGAGKNVYCSVESIRMTSHYLLQKIRKYTDVRLVYAPADVRGALGGMEGFNFQFPRYALDFGFLRAYGEDGKPLDTSDIFLQPETRHSVKEGDFTMIMGHPGSTERSRSSASLKHLQEGQLPALVGFLRAKENLHWERLDAIKMANDSKTVKLRAELKDEHFSYQNSRQAYQGMWEGLVRTKYPETRAREDERLAGAIFGSSEDAITKYGHITSELRRIYSAIGKAEPVNFWARQMTSAGTLFGLPRQLAVGLREIEVAQEELRELIRIKAPQKDIDHKRQFIALLENARKEVAKDARAHWSWRDAVHLLAEAIRFHETTFELPFLADFKWMGKNWLEKGESLMAAIQAGSDIQKWDDAEMVMAADGKLGDKKKDTYFQFVEGLRKAGSASQVVMNSNVSGPYLKTLRTRYEEARAKFLGLSMGYYDANFTTRFTYGSVKSYKLPSGDVGWGTYYDDLLKPRDQQPKIGKTPVIDLMPDESADFCMRMGKLPECRGMVVNFVTDNDTHGGNSGSGVLNKDLKVVGTLFDGNWTGLQGRYTFDADPSNRSVSVAFPVSFHYMQNGNKKHRIAAELRAADDNFPQRAWMKKPAPPINPR